MVRTVREDFPNSCSSTPCEGNGTNRWCREKFQLSENINRRLSIICRQKLSSQLKRQWVSQKIVSSQTTARYWMFCVIWIRTWQSHKENTCTWNFTSHTIRYTHTLSERQSVGNGHGTHRHTMKTKLNHWNRILCCGWAPRAESEHLMHFQIAQCLHMPNSDDTCSQYSDSSRCYLLVGWFVSWHQ